MLAAFALFIVVLVEAASPSQVADEIFLSVLNPEPCAVIDVRGLSAML